MKVHRLFIPFQTSQVDGYLHDNIEDAHYGDEIDTFNEDTFGSGALGKFGKQFTSTVYLQKEFMLTEITNYILEEDWELEHNQLVELGSSNAKGETKSKGKCKALLFLISLQSVGFWTCE